MATRISYNGGNQCVKSYKELQLALATMVAISEQSEARIGYNGSNALATMLTLNLFMKTTEIITTMITTIIINIIILIISSNHYHHRHRTSPTWSETVSQVLFRFDLLQSVFF